ncbi:hypothetical protein Acr_10g0003780 [Actinidia rufa]|uniref:Uncharacterized protein n=1 Tax=Actinidia rufa TaxID=165716 RepID=A0A7J0F8R2_9ERIC|nr:hypothetical protein Acr_10g0003780 [Actinidia rufa]
MATSLLSPLTTPTIDNREPVHSLIASNASFLHRSKLSFAQPVPNSRSSTVRRRCLRSRKSFDHIPKQFRDENLKDGCESPKIPYQFVLVVYMRLLQCCDCFTLFY